MRRAQPRLRKAKRQSVGAAVIKELRRLVEREAHAHSVSMSWVVAKALDQYFELDVVPNYTEGN
jgi:hypothetical protein